MDSLNSTNPLHDSPFAQFLALEEREIAEILKEEGIYTPSTIAGKGELQETGFVNLVVYNPHDGAFYNKFSEPPLDAALKAGLINNGASEDFYASANELLQHEMIAPHIRNIINHVKYLTTEDKFLQLHPVSHQKSSLRKDNIAWLDALCKTDSLWTIDTIMSLLPLQFNHIGNGSEENESITFEYSQTGFHSTLTLQEVFNKFSTNIKKVNASERGFYLLMFILDTLMLLPWVTKGLDFDALVEGIEDMLEGESPSSSLIANADQVIYTKVVLPLSYPHSVLGGLVVAWPTSVSDDESRTQRIIQKLQIQAGRTGAELKAFWEQIAALRMSNGQSSDERHTDIMVDLLGPRAYSKKDGQQYYSLLPKGLLPQFQSFQKVDVPKKPLLSESVENFHYLPRISGATLERVKDYQNKVSLSLKILTGRELYQIPRFNHDVFLSHASKYLLKNQPRLVERKDFTWSVLYSALYYYLNSNGLDAIPKKGVAINVYNRGKDVALTRIVSFEPGKQDRIVYLEGASVKYFTIGTGYRAATTAAAFRMSVDEDNIQIIFNRMYGISIVFVDKCWRFGEVKKNQPAHYIVFYNGYDIPLDIVGNIDVGSIEVVDDVEKIFPTYSVDPSLEFKP